MCITNLQGAPRLMQAHNFLPAGVVSELQYPKPYTLRPNGYDPIGKDAPERRTMSILYSSAKPELFLTATQEEVGFFMQRAAGCTESTRQGLARDVTRF